ncbi:MAG: purine-binding chemotaxis protein CheW [Coriobacteriia bacterium]|nr:purine-binding chemotaxis protein CheW [Coriobacteriia bacterium]
MSQPTNGGFEHLSPSAMDILRKRAESLASESEADVQLDLMSLLLFRLADEWYAIRNEDVREIYNEYSVTPIPRVPDYILGVVNIRGEIVSVTHLATLMRIPQHPDHAPDAQQPSAIVASTDECVSALIVDEIGDIVEVASSELEPPLSVVDRGHADWVSGSVYLDGRLVGVIDLEKILRPIGENE